MIPNGKNVKKPTAVQTLGAVSLSVLLAGCDGSEVGSHRGWPTGWRAPKEWAVPGVFGY